MGLTKDQQIYAAIDLLKHHGYKVYKDYSMLIGKWVAFWQEGMTHISVSYTHLRAHET